MIGRLPEHVRHTDVDADRLMIAAWLRLQGDDGGIGTMLARGVDVDELAEVLGAFEACFDDAERYAWVTYAQGRPGGGSTWLEWGERECERLLADARAHASRLAAAARVVQGAA